MKKIALLIFILFCSCNKNEKNQYFNRIEGNDLELSQPVEGDWLFSHKEKGQNYEQYQKSNHIVPTKDSNVIYIRPI